MTITYPEPTDQIPSFMGRNGYFHSIGIDVHVMACGLVALQPVTSRGKIGRCAIELPTDAETLRAVAQELQRIADSL